MKNGSEYERLKAQCGTWAREDHYVNPNQGHDFRMRVKADKNHSTVGFTALTLVLSAGVFGAVFKGDWILDQVQSALNDAAPKVVAIVEH
jgi:Mg2+/citrate symporter